MHVRNGKPRVRGQCTPNVIHYACENWETTCPWPVHTERDPLCTWELGNHVSMASAHRTWSTMHVRIGKPRVRGQCTQNVIHYAREKWETTCPWPVNTERDPLSTWKLGNHVSVASAHRTWSTKHVRIGKPRVRGQCTQNVIHYAREKWETTCPWPVHTERDPLCMWELGNHVSVASAHRTWSTMHVRIGKPRVHGQCTQNVIHYARENWETTCPWPVHTERDPLCTWELGNHVSMASAHRTWSIMHVRIGKPRVHGQCTQNVIHYARENWETTCPWPVHTFPSS